jgi:hypothetical protein
MMEKAQEVEDSKPDKLLSKSYKVKSYTNRNMKKSYVLGTSLSFFTQTETSKPNPYVRWQQRICCYLTSLSLISKT